MLQDFLKSFENTDLSKLSLKDLVKLEKTLSLYEATTPLSVQREKINQEYMKRAKKDENLRFSVHEIKTGYKKESWQGGGLPPEQSKLFHKRDLPSDEWDSSCAWKLHLDVVPNRKHPVTKEISDFLIEFGVHHKILDGGDGGKGMTIYTGSYDDTIKLAKIIQEKFGSKIYIPPVYTDQFKEEYAFEPTVYGRFGIGKTHCIYPMKNIGIVGISPFLNILLTFEKTVAKSKKLEQTGITQFFMNYRVPALTISGKKLLTYITHKLYVALYGHYYYGTSLEQFENKFFGNNIPAKNTAERKDWDELAETFVQEAQEKTFFKMFQDRIKGYPALDFTDTNTRLYTSISSKWKQKKQTPDYKEMASDIISKMKREI
ncbi:MAG: hypothetical protein MJ165_00320 [Alphaproteobacteria bacterium]|nr:hypothetical protein [Alphaproteobacteria bacterium]